MGAKHSLKNTLSRRGFLFSTAVAGSALLRPKSASALKCMPPDFVRAVNSTKNIVAGEITKVVRKAGRPERYKVKILRKLKDGGLFARKDSFEFPADNGWDRLQLKKGQILLFFFDDDLTVLCNVPILIK